MPNPLTYNIQRQPIPKRPPDEALDDCLRRIEKALNRSSSLLQQQANEIAAVPTFGTGLIADVASSDSDGVSTNIPRADHAHRGTHSITGPAGTRYGDVTLQGFPLSQLLGVFTFYGLQSMFYIINRVSADHTIVAGEFTIYVTGSHTITLPAASIGTDYTVYVRNDNQDMATTCIVSRAGADTIDGATTVTLQPPRTSQNFVGAFFVSNGVSRWAANFCAG